MIARGVLTACLGVVATMALAPTRAAYAEDRDPAWVLYDRAYAALAHGDRAAAQVDLQQVVGQYPAHPAAARAREQLAALAAPTLVAPTAMQDQDADETSTGPSKEARGELVFWSTATSAYAAYNTCRILSCSGARETALVYSTVIGGALAASYLLSPTVHQGQAQLYNSAQTWTAWTSLAINDGAPRSKGEAGGAIALQVGGIGLAAGLWEVWRPSRGDVALANSALLWGSLLGLYGELAGKDASLRTTVVIGDLALAAGAALSTQVHMSRGRTLLIDAGGVAGSLAGGLIALIADSNQAPEIAIELGIGTVAGLAAATLMSREWDLPALPNASVAPTALVDPATHKTAFGLGATLAF